MAKKYRIIEKVYKEGTSYQENIYYPQVVDSFTLNQKIDPWDFYYKNVNETDSVISFHAYDAAVNFIESRKAEDIPVKTIIHTVK